MRGVRIKYTKPKRVARPAYFRGLYHLKAARCPGTVASRSRAKQGGDTEPRATTLRMAWPARGPLRMASIRFTSLLLQLHALRLRPFPTPRLPMG